MGARRTPTRRQTLRTAAGVCLLAGAVACSSSSSGGSSSSGLGGIPTPTGPPPTSLHGHHAGGPNGIISTPVYNPPSSGVPGGSVVFPHVDRTLDRKIVDKVLAMPGVAHAAYYPQFKQFQVYFKSDATSDQRDAVYRYVTGLTS
ncbi:MAG TPA: hypothetical protein VHB69_09545 [Mycobacteriales bacterium]|nr:hypothetical protein [Mycobacteriales bacterium]